MRCADRRERTAMLVVAAEILTCLKPFAANEQRCLAVQEEAARSARRHSAYLAAAARAGSAIAEHTCAQAEEELRRMSARAGTEEQKQLVETLAAEVIDLRAADGQESYALAQPETSAEARQDREESSLQEVLVRLEHLIETRQFEEALVACDSLSTFDQIPQATREAQRQRVLACAEQFVRESIRAALGTTEPDLPAAETAVVLARRLSLDASLITAAQQQITAARERHLQTQVHRALDEGRFDEAFHTIATAHGAICEPFVEALTSAAVEVRAARELAACRERLLQDQGEGGSRDAALAEHTALAMVSRDAPSASTWLAVNACVRAFKELRAKRWVAMAKAVSDLRAAMGDGPVVADLSRQCLAGAAAQRRFFGRTSLLRQVQRILIAGERKKPDGTA
jgi:hypothetical protein